MSQRRDIPGLSGPSALLALMPLRPLALAAAFLLCLTSSAPALDGSLPAFFSASHPRTVIVGGDHDYPPYEFLDEDGEPAGFNVDLTRALSRVVGLDVEIRLGPWSEIRADLEAGRIDAVHGMFFSHERDKMVDFAPPHSVINHTAFSREDAAPVRDMLDLKDREVIVMRGDIMHDWILEMALTYRIVAVETQAQALRLLASGKHDYALAAQLPGLHWIEQFDLSNVVMAGPPLLSSKYCYAVREGDTELLSGFSEGLAILHQNGVYQELVAKWLGREDRDPVHEQAGRFALLVLVPVFVLMLGGYVWSWMLRRKVESRTRELTREMAERARAETLLRESETRLRTIFDTIQTGVLLVERETRTIASVNRAASAMIGLPPKAIVGRVCHSFVCPALKGQCPLNHPGATLDNAERTLLRGDGRTMPILKTVVPVELDGKPHLLESFVDISGLKKAEENFRTQEALLRSLVDSIPDMIFWKDTEGRFLGCNTAYARHRDLTPERIVGNRVSELLSPDSAAHFEKTDREVLETGRPFAGEELETMPDGRISHQDVVKTPFFGPEGDVIGVVGVIRDATERKQLEILKEDVDRILRHDLKAQLGGIISVPQILLEDTTLTEEQRELIQLVRDSGRRMHELINRSLDLHRMETGSFVFEPEEVDLGRVLSSLSREMEDLLRAHEISLNLPPARSFAVMADPGLTHTLLSNLLANAIEASPRGGVVQVELQREHGVAQILIHNQGTVPEALRTSFFEKYATFGKKHGTGLGTYSARLMARTMGGEISFTTSEDEGTTLRVTLTASNSG